VKDARVFVPAQPLGGGAKGSQGDALWTSPNPELGAVFTYYLKDELKTRKAKRQATEKEAAKKNTDVPIPSWDELRREDREEAPTPVLTVLDESGAVVRRLTGPSAAGFHRVTWDLRHPAPNPVTGTAPRPAAPPPAGDDDDGPAGPLAVPGGYRVQLALRVDGVETPVEGPQSFRIVPVSQVALPAAEQARITAFNQEAVRLLRAAMGAGQALGELETRLRLLAQAIEQTPQATALRDSARVARTAAQDLRVTFSGDQTIGGRNEPTPVTIMGRLNRVIGSTWSTTTGATVTHRRSLEIAGQRFGEFLPRLTEFAERLKRLEAQAEAAGVPWTPGRIPTWRP
jgi:hypothetical protein